MRGKFVIFGMADGYMGCALGVILRACEISEDKKDGFSEKKDVGGEKLQQSVRFCRNSYQ